MYDSEYTASYGGQTPIAGKYNIYDIKFMYNSEYIVKYGWQAPIIGKYNTCIWYKCIIVNI